MSMSDRDGKIWFDGKLIEWRDAKIHVLSHTLHYGCGAFEGVRAYKTTKGTAIFRLREHTERLFNSAKILRMKIPYSFEQVCEAQREVVRANKLESCYLRPLTWIGDEKLGVSPKGNAIHLMIAAWTWGAYLGDEGLKKGIRVKTSSYTRHHVNITEFAHELHIPVYQRRITRDEVYIADEAFFTGTAAEVTPIREYDRVTLGEGVRGPITTKVQNAFFDIVNGRNAKYAEWLTAV
jgi:branched-subunit amino acid aminotransferase/4-amino-4-deoxychorismate lyase